MARSREGRGPMALWGEGKEGEKGRKGRANWREGKIRKDGGD